MGDVADELYVLLRSAGFVPGLVEEDGLEEFDAQPLETIDIGLRQAEAQNVIEPLKLGSA